MRTLLTTSIAVILAVIGNAQNFNRPIPPGFHAYEFVQHDSIFDGYLISTPFPTKNTKGKDQYLSILDQNGYLVWYTGFSSSHVDFKFNDKLQQYSYVNRKSFRNEGYQILDKDFNLIDSLGAGNNLWMDIHEFILLDNGNYLLSARTDSIVDLSKDTLNGMPGSDTTHIRAFVIQEFDSQKKLIFQWNSNDHIDPLESYEEVYGYNIADFDYCHGNAIEKVNDGNYLVSMRHTNSIYKIDKNSGKIIWRLGGKRSDFSFPNDSGFSGQHDIRQLQNGNLTLFDNSNSSNNKISRAVEYKLDTNNWTATKIWEYVHDTGFFARAMGNFITSNKGFKLINYGLIYRPFPTYAILAQNDKLIAEMYYKDSIATYRTSAIHPSNAIERTEVKCVNNNGSVKLTATVGSQFIWNTGERSNEITVNKPGVYQVWANKGIGMLGSEPIIIENISNYCLIGSLAEENPLSNSNPVQLFDLSGKQIKEVTVPGIYVRRFGNGSVKKVFLQPQKYTE